MKKRVWDLITQVDPAIDSRQTKIHLAVHNGIDHPLDVYLQGDFQQWQRHQRRPYFQLPFVVALVQMREDNRWLFAGAYESHGCQRVNRDDWPYLYRLTERARCRNLDGRLIAHFEHSFRQVYLRAERWIDRIFVHDILNEPYHEV